MAINNIITRILGKAGVGALVGIALGATAMHGCCGIHVTPPPKLESQGVTKSDYMHGTYDMQDKTQCVCSREYNPYSFGSCRDVCAEHLRAKSYYQYKPKR